jgi:hypothetical protein
MTPAEQARNQAISIEAKKDRLAQRQSSDWSVTFTVQDADMDPRFTSAKMGTRYVMVLVEIGDDELPVQKEARAQPRPERRPTIPQPDGAERMPWREVQPAAQAGIRANDPVFVAFLEEAYPKVCAQHNNPADTIRSLCFVKSRSEFSTDPRKRVLWHQLDTQFQAWQAKERVGA